MVRERLRTYRDASVTTLHVSPEGATLEHRLQTLASLLPLVRELEAE
jgi:hypothetical protein